jgi:hypothetical protein
MNPIITPFRREQLADPRLGALFPTAAQEARGLPHAAARRQFRAVALSQHLRGEAGHLHRLRADAGRDRGLADGSGFRTARHNRPGMRQNSRAIMICRLGAAPGSR